MGCAGDITWALDDPQNARKSLNATICISRAIMHQWTSKMSCTIWIVVDGNGWNGTLTNKPHALCSHQNVVYFCLFIFFVCISFSVLLDWGWCLMLIRSHLTLLVVGRRLPAPSWCILPIPSSRARSWPRRDSTTHADRAWKNVEISKQHFCLFIHAIILMIC